MEIEIDDQVFRNAMGKFATGVTVVTTTLDNQVHGMTANAFMSVSLHPKLVVVSVAEKAQMHNKIAQSGKFAVSILTDEQREMSMYFAGQMKENRDIEFEWISDMPVIRHSLAQIICKVYSTHKAGDHTLFIGEVVDILVEEGAPLTFFEGKYGQIVS